MLIIAERINALRKLIAQAISTGDPLGRGADAECVHRLLNPTLRRWAFHYVRTVWAYGI